MSPTSPQILFLLAVVLTAAACGGSAAPGPGGPGGGRPPMPVEVLTLEERPVEQTSEFIGSLKSRSSTTIQPQVEGFITRIAVRSGDVVRPGTLLFEIDSAPQQAAVAALESTRAVRAAELEYARQEHARTRSLYAAGAVSQRELSQAETAERTAEAALKAVEEQVRQQRTELAYYRVTAPSGGVVGDVPVRVGDRVTSSTELTTVAENDVLELYVSVPVQQAPALRVGLPVRILDDRQQLLATNPITFVSPTVEPTQTVLAKALLVDGRGRFRADQFVRAQIVWRSAPGLTIPLTSVMRINGQYFVYLVDTRDGGTVARQQAVTLGGLVGNDYVVRDGLSAGQQLVTGGVQKIGDGAPVMVGPPPGAPGQPGGGEPAKKVGEPAKSKAS